MFIFYTSKFFIFLHLNFYFFPSKFLFFSTKIWSNFKEMFFHLIVQKVIVKVNLNQFFGFKTSFLWIFDETFLKTGLKLEKKCSGFQVDFFWFKSNFLHKIFSQKFTIDFDNFCLPIFVKPILLLFYTKLFPFFTLNVLHFLH